MVVCATSGTGHTSMQRAWLALRQHNDSLQLCGSRLRHRHMSAPVLSIQ
jgi:hypothetical protein